MLSLNPLRQGCDLAMAPFAKCNCTIDLCFRIDAPADMIYERHTVLSSLLINLGIPKEIALEDACKIEHVISPESFEGLKKIMNKI